MLRPYGSPGRRIDQKIAPCKAAPMRLDHQMTNSALKTMVRVAGNKHHKAGRISNFAPLIWLIINIKAMTCSAVLLPMRKWSTHNVTWLHVKRNVRNPGQLDSVVLKMKAATTTRSHLPCEGAVFDCHNRLSEVVAKMMK